MERKNVYEYIAQGAQRQQEKQNNQCIQSTRFFFLVKTRQTHDNKRASHDVGGDKVAQQEKQSKPIEQHLVK